MTSPAVQADPAVPAPEVPAPEQPPISDEEVFSFFADEDGAPSPEPAPEAAAADEAVPAPEPATNPLEALSDDDLVGHERVQRLVEREAEARVTAERTRIEQEASLREAARERGYARSDAFFRDFEKLVVEGARDLDDDGRPQVTREALSSYLGPVVRYGSEETLNAVGSILNADLGDYQLTDADRALLQHATAMVAGQPLQPGPLFRAWLDIRDRVVLEQQRESDRAAIRAEVERDFRERARAANAERRARDNDAQRRAGPQPTRTPQGTPIGAHDLSTTLGLAQAARDDAISDEEFQRLWAARQA